MDPPLFVGDVSHQVQKETWKHTILLSYQSLGIVYGRLATAPLYVFGSIHEKDFMTHETPYEFFSFIFWTLTVISLLKYAFIVLRANDNGEGGTFALYSLLCRHAKVGLLPRERISNEVMHLSGSPSICKKESKARQAIEKHRSSHYLMLFLALFGCCMMINDGVFTPAISVLSASKGVERSLSEIFNSSSLSNMTNSIITKDLDRYVAVPTACAIQVGLFMLQHYGTHKIGYLFAPIITVWLLFISGVGVYNIFHYNPKILSAIFPTYMLRFIKNFNKQSWRSLGSILLCIAGTETMFADLGHFSKKSIKLTFICIVFPALLLSYAGQAAYISEHMSITDFNHISRSIPDRTRHVFVVLSLLASAVGSQASLTASFSIINQCLALGCFPRTKVIHTSDKIHGQIYIPDVNWVLMILSLSVTVGFRDINRIGYAAGTAITFGMLVTTCLMSLVIALYWERSLFVSACFLIFFGFIEAMYLSACMCNFHRGAWYLVVLSVTFLTVMLSWHYGTMKKHEFDLQNKVSTEWLTDLGPVLGVSRVPGIGIIHTDIVSGIPAFFSHFITNLPAFHQVLIFLSFKSLPLPHVAPEQRYLIGRVGHKDYRIFRCIVRYGYCDHVKDTDEIEEQIISSIGEFISLEENDSEDLTSPEGKMIIVGDANLERHTLLPATSSRSSVEPSYLTNNRTVKGPSDNGAERGSSNPVRRKKVRFALPPESPKMRPSVRVELQELVDARECGTAYFLGQPHLVVRSGSNILKRFLIIVYVCLDKNSREPPVALNIPHAALVEVGTVYTI